MEPQGKKTQMLSNSKQIPTNISSSKIKPFKTRSSQQELKMPVNQDDLQKKTPSMLQTKQSITQRDNEQSSIESSSKMKDEDKNIISFNRNGQKKNFIDSRGPNSLLMSKMTVTNNASINYEEMRSPHQAQIPVEANIQGPESSHLESVLKDSELFQPSILQGSKLTPGQEIAISTMVNEQMTTAVKHEHSSHQTLEDSSQMLFSNRRNIDQNTIIANDQQPVEVFSSLKLPQSNAKIVTDRVKFAKMTDQELSIFSESKEIKNQLKIVNIGTNSRNNQHLFDYQTTGNIKNIISKKQRTHLASSIQDSNQKVSNKLNGYNSLKSTTPGYSNLPKIEAYTNIQISNQDSLMLPFDKTQHVDLKFRHFEQKRSSSYVNLYETQKFSKKQNTVRNQMQPWILNSSQGHSTDSVSKYFGKQNNPRDNNIQGLQGMKDLTLRDALTKSHEALREPSPPKKKLKQQILYKPNQTMLNLKTDKLMKVIKGRDIKKQFINESKQEIRQYMNYVMAQEDKMMGYMEFNNQNQNEQYQIQQAIKEKEDKKQREEKEKIEEIRQNNLRQMLDNANKVQLLPKILQDSRTNKDKNPVEQANNITTNVLENWLNQTLSDAEHLDIPGCILRPEHKNPIFRYGIDRIELNNWGIPDEYIDRVYRCLFVYSVGFYEMVNKVIEHSGQKYQIITRLWKVFAVLLEYCCQNDYQMIITKISTEHEQVIEKLKEGFDLQCQDFYDNEKILKNNIAVLQQSNQELERDRTNERSLRLRLEEEYMQNSKNHEEEVQLRLKFESKLNTMHGQIRESDIMFARCKEELENSLKKIELQDSIIDQQNKELIKVKKDNHESEETIKKLNNDNIFIEDENTKKKEQLVVNEKIMKINIDETNQTRYQLGQVQNDNNNLQLRVENLQEIIAQFEKKQNAVENLHQEAEKQIKVLEERNKQLKEQCDSHLVELSQTKHIVQNIEVTNEQKITQNDMLQEQVDRYKNESEMLDLKTRTQEGEINSFEENLKRLTKDLEDASERLHQTNRYRHELEIRVKSQQITTQKQFQQIVEKEQNIDLQKKQISTYQSEINDKDKRLQVLTKKLEETQAEFDKKVELHSKEIIQLKKLLDTEKLTKFDWAQKFKAHDAALNEKQQQVFTQKQQIDVMKIDLDKNQIIITQQTEYINSLEIKTQNLSDELHQTIQERNSRQAELVDMLDVARKLEAQRHRQIGEVERQFEDLKAEHSKMQCELQMTIEDMVSRVVREEEKLENFKEQQNKQTQELKQKHLNEVHSIQNQHGFMMEDFLKQIFNRQNQIDVKQFQLMEAQANLKQQKSRLSMIYKQQMKQRLAEEVKGQENQVKSKAQTPEPEELTMESVDIGIQVEEEILKVNGEKVMVGVKCQEFKWTQTESQEAFTKGCQVNLDPMNSSFYNDNNAHLSKYMTQKVSKLASKYQNSANSNNQGESKLQTLSQKSQKEPKYLLSPQQAAIKKREIIDHIQTFKDPKINIQQNSSAIFDKVEQSLRSQILSYQEKQSQFGQSSNIASSSSQFQLQQQNQNQSLSPERVSGDENMLRMSLKNQTENESPSKKIQSSSDSKFKALKPHQVAKGNSNNHSVLKRNISQDQRGNLSSNKQTLEKSSEILESIQSHISKEIEKKKIIDTQGVAQKIFSIPTQQTQQKLSLVKQGQSISDVQQPYALNLVSEYENNDRQISTFRDQQHQGITEESILQGNSVSSPGINSSVPQSYYRPNPQFEISKIGKDIGAENENLSIIQDMADYSIAIQNQVETKKLGDAHKKKQVISQTKRNNQIKGLLKGANARAMQQLK